MIKQEINDCVLYCADCADLIDDLPNIDALVTDPPYGIGENSKKVASRGKLAKPKDYGQFDWDQSAPQDLIDMFIYMEHPSSFCTICTVGCVDELIGHLLSLYTHHGTTPVYVLCDTPTMVRTNNSLPFLEHVEYICELDRYSGMNRKQMENAGIWTTFQMKKADVITISLKRSNDVLYLDSDILVTDKILVDKSKELGVSPHFIKKSYTDIYGYYNGGMLWAKNPDIPVRWVKYSKTSRFYDQACIEELVKDFNYFEFDMTYNISWWRMNQRDDDIVDRFGNNFDFDNSPIKCVHTHFGSSDNQKFNVFIINKLSEAKRWKELMFIERIINGFWCVLIPKQPLPGRYYHTDDSFRELAQLTAEKIDDFNFIRVEGITIPRIGKVVCLYDRPRDEWMTPEVERGSLKVFVGNMDTSVMNSKFSPWIFWPRKPRVLEKFLEEPQPPKDIESVFIGNIENSVQAKHRDTKWSDVIQVFHLTNGHKHLFTQEEYLTKMARSKWGLCLKGFGLKCHREVECMALGVVPLITDGIPMHSYMNPPVEGKHFLRVSTPEDVPRVIQECSNWEEMSKACTEWYMENVHSNNWWYTMLKSMN